MKKISIRQVRKLISIEPRYISTSTWKTENRIELQGWQIKLDKRKINKLARLHLALLGALLILIITTPVLMRQGFSIFDEEVAESIMILFLTGLSLCVFAFYRREIRRKEQSLTQFSRHVGTLNLQIEQLSLLYKDIEESLENRADLRYAICRLADRVLRIVNAAWVVLRTIELENGRTVTECRRGSNKTAWLAPKISNRRLLESRSLDGYCVICSGLDYLRLQTFCVLPVKELSKGQSMLIRVTLDNLTMLSAVLNSYRRRE